MKRSGLRRLFILSAGILAWPFLWLLPYVNPFWRYCHIGNDFQILYLNYKIYLLNALTHGHVPLWSPSEAAGFPFYSNPFTQTFYPFNLPLVGWTLLRGGYNQVDHQRFAVFGISLFALGLFFWLRSLRTRLRPALYAALTVGCSYKITEILRFPNALHTIAWVPWLLWAMTRIARTANRFDRLRCSVLIFLFSLCYLTAGYPYYVYYSLFLFIPYFVLLLIPSLRWKLFRIRRIRWPSVAPALVIPAIAAELLVSPYHYRMMSLMQQTNGRMGNDFLYSINGSNTPIDTLGSFVFPAASSSEGWFYLGILFLMLMLLFVAHSSEWRPSQAASDRAIKWTLIPWICVILYMTYGQHSLLFRFLWHWMPGFSSMREWPRMNIIFLPLLAWLLAIAYRRWDYWYSHRRSNDRATKSVMRQIAWITLGIVAVQLVLIVKGVQSDYWTAYYVAKFANGLHIPDRTLSLALKATFVLSSLMAGAFLVFLLHRRRLRPRTMNAAFILFSTIEIMMVGPWMWAARPCAIEPRRRIEPARLDFQSFHVPRKNVYDTLSLNDAFSVGVLEFWDFYRYVQFLDKQKNDRPALEQLLGIRDGKKIYFSKRIDYATARDFLRDASGFSPAPTYTVMAYTGEELALDVSLPSSSYLSFIDNWDPDWTVEVDGLPASLEILLGTFKSVALPAGRHRVRFLYRPKGFAWLLKTG